MTSEYDSNLIRTILYKHFGYSRANITRLKTIPNGIMLNGKNVTVREIVHTGDILSLAVEDTNEDENPYLRETAIEPTILYEDDWCVVFDKPYNMPTIPTHGHRDDTLANCALYHYHKEGIPFVFRPVNRLDRATSGMVLVAKNKVAAALLGNAMKSGNIHKHYTAVVEGILPNDSGKIDGYIVREGDSIITRKLVDSGKESEYSLTTYEVISRTDTHTIVICSPITGRTHQLRVHFSSIGHPIIGDELYSDSNLEYDRLYLHASQLSFEIFAKIVEVNSPLPTQFQTFTGKEIK